MSEEKDFVGYCGMYCNACGLRTGEIRAAVSQLRETMNMYELARVAQLFGGIADIPQFLKTLDALESMFGKCNGCKTGGGWAGCPMRKCCVKENLKSCYECNKMPCQELLKFQKKHFLIPAPHYGKQNTRYEMQVHYPKEKS